MTTPCFLNLKIMKIFLDDIRNSQDCVKYMGERIGALTYLYMGNWIVVRNYKEFVKAVSENINEKSPEFMNALKMALLSNKSLPFTFSYRNR